MKRIYFDYAASTPVNKEVLKAMRPYFNKVYANAAATHWFGQQASAAVFEARQKIAKALNCDYKEIVFTGSATEANNLALRGIISNFKIQISKKQKPRIITSVIEHESVLETCKDLEERGLAEVIYIPVTKDGIVNVDKLKAALNEKTVLISIMYANNQIGTVQPIREISRAIAEFKSLLNPNHYTPNPLFHTDAVQAFQFLKCDVQELGVDLLTLSAHKIYGPKGIGVLYVKKGNSSLTPNFYNLAPITTGGGQEWGLRSGSENVSSIVGFGKAVEITESSRVSEFKRLKALRDYFWKNLKKILPEAELNGSMNERLPNNLNIYFPGRPSQDLHIELDLWGIATSAGAACASRLCKPSYVIEALGYKDDRANSSLRLSFGRSTTKAEVDLALTIFKKRFRIN